MYRIFRKIIIAKPIKSIPKVIIKTKNEYVSDAANGRSIQSSNQD
tara:strand:- start:589 stop:723 length:135 start_codon:yes stop_codon:yes gene_type:complete